MSLKPDTANPIRPGEELNPQALQTYLNEWVADFGIITDIRQFPGGYSNLTYLLSTSAQEYVLRRHNSAGQYGGKTRLITDNHAPIVRSIS